MTTQQPEQFNSSPFPQQNQSNSVLNSQGLTEKNLDSASIVEPQKEEASAAWQEASQEISTQAQDTEDVGQIRATQKLLILSNNSSIPLSHSFGQSLL